MCCQPAQRPSCHTPQCVVPAPVQPPAFSGPARLSPTHALEPHRLEPLGDHVPHYVKLHVLALLEHGVEQLAVKAHFEGPHLSRFKRDLGYLLAEVVVQLCRPPSGTQVEPSDAAEDYLDSRLVHISPFSLPLGHSYSITKADMRKVTKKTMDTREPWSRLSRGLPTWPVRRPHSARGR